MTTPTIAHVTTARSDYGPAQPLIKALFDSPHLSARLWVGGAHLSRQMGHTVDEIRQDGLPISAEVPFLRPDGSADLGQALAQFSALMAQQQPDIVVLYGDRLELLPIATAAVLTRTPIAHVCGGDVTEGALDEQVRHAVTKMAHLHFPSTPLSARRVRQMGEDPTRIHCVGDPALDHFVHGEHASPNELTELLGFTPDHRTLLITLHPETASGSTMSLQSAEFCSALQDFEGSLVITAPAPDPGHQTVRTAMERLASQHPRAVFIESLGSRRYRGLLKRVGAMAGNSSSGIIEAASVPLPVVNVGDRQAGRERAANVIDVPFNASAIRQALQTALSQQFRQSLQRLNNPYGDGNAAHRITAVLKALPPRDELLRKRWFQPDESMAVS